MSKCVFMQDMLKSRCKFGEVRTAKTSWLVGHFSEHGFTGSGARKPQWELKGSALNFFAACSEASGGFNCVSKVLLKSQC